MKPIHEMLFEDFYAALRPTGGVNRLPPVGAGEDVLIYSVYMNGPLAKELPDDLGEQHYKDVMLHALTEKLGFDSTSYRDNIKVAEMVAIRNAWMTTILEATIQHDNRVVHLSDEIVHDYELLTKGFNHPVLLEQIEMQRAMSKNLAPALKAAEQRANSPLTQRVPDVVIKGVILSQNLDFTVQAIGENEFVTHDNNKLGTVPPIGADVTISYYRGQGQVFENVTELKFSGPFIEQKSGSLGLLVSHKDTSQQILLFNNAMEFEKFVGAQKLPYALVKDAVALKVAAQSKTIGQAAANSPTPNAVEKMAAAVLSAGQTFGLKLDSVKVSQMLEGGRTPDGLSIGKVVGIDRRLGLVYQSLGQGRGTVHRIDTLSKLPEVGEVATISFKNGRGLVENDGQGRGQGR